MRVIGLLLGSSPGLAMRVRVTIQESVEVEVLVWVAGAVGVEETLTDARAGKGRAVGPTRRKPHM